MILIRNMVCHLCSIRSILLILIVLGSISEVISTPDNDESKSFEEMECGLWLGPSIIKDEAAHGFGLGMYTGKFIPKDTKMHAEVLVPVYDYEDDRHPPLREYLWSAEPLRKVVLESLESTLIFVPGLGSIAPCTQVNFNLEQVHNLQYNDYGVIRSSNGTAGAFSYWNNTMFTAVRDIQPGEELVVECSDDDFDPSDYPKQKFDPKDNTQICLDDKLEERRSNVHGKGLFAKKDLAKNTVLTSSPMTPIHRSELYMGETFDTDEEGQLIDSSSFTVRRHQLLLNYCYGQEDSDLLWLPHGPLVNAINHSPNKSPNAKVQWHTGDGEEAIEVKVNSKKGVDYQHNANLARRAQFHHPELLEAYFEEVANVHGKGLVMDIVSIRDIQADEEILIDYGSAWEKAFKEHSAKWQQEDWDNPKYMSPQIANEQYAKKTVRTLHEQHKKPYARNLQTACYFGGDWWLDDEGVDDADNDPVIYESWNNQPDRDKVCLIPCHVLERTKDEKTDKITYTVKLIDMAEENISIDWDCHIYKKFEYIYEDVPRRGITFVDKPHYSDSWLLQSFRHEIGMPDSMYPDVWKKPRRVRRRYVNGTTTISSEEGDTFKRKSVRDKEEILEEIRLKKQPPSARTDL